MDKINPHELVVDSDVVAPSPLDPAIASLLLRTRSNRVTEGYDLSVSAFFGSERVKLAGGDFSVNVEISIDKAQIELEFVRCAATVIDADNGESSDERQIEQKLTATRRKERRGRMLVKGQLSGRLQGSGSGELEYVATNSNDAEVEISRSRRNWQKIGPKTVLIGTVVGDLEGMEIDDFQGWRVIPDDATLSSGVVAYLSVRENWINIVKVDSESFTGRIGRKARNLFKSNDEHKQQLFALLLRHLSTIGLSEPNHPDQAILAVHPFVVRPDIENATSTTSAPSTGNVPLDSLRIEEFLNSSPGSEVETLILMGITHHDIRQHTDQPKRRSGLFTGMSSPPKALEAYKIICEHKSISRPELEKMVKGRVAADLRSLGLIRTKNYMLYLSADEVKDPEGMLRFAAAKAESVATTRAILLQDSSAFGVQVAEMLSTKFGIKCSTEASKVRVGNALMRWTRWLEPHLIDPNSVDGARMKVTALDKSYARGRRSMATPQNVAIAKAAIAAGQNKKSVAELIGVSVQTISRWGKEGILD